MTNNEFNAEEAVRLYVEQELSVREIATHFGVAYGKVYSALRSRVVMRQSNGPGPRRGTEYIEIAEVMRRRILNGDWEPNRKILSQGDLAKMFDVRQQAIREAVADLRRRGYLRTVPSRGTYVRPPQDWEA